MSGHFTVSLYCETLLTEVNNNVVSFGRNQHQGLPELKIQAKLEKCGPEPYRRNEFA